MVALDYPSLVGVVHLDFLSEHKEQLLTPMAFQTFGNLLLAGVNPRVTESRQLPRVALSGHDGPHNHLSGHPAQVAESIEIRWPSGKIETLENVPADAIYTIVEGSGIRSTTPLPPPAVGAMNRAR